MRTWAVSNQKGGVGKTTTAVNLGGLLANQGHRVLLVDLDPHGSLTSYFKHDPEAVNPSVYDLFRDEFDLADVDEVVYPTAINNISLLPACTALATLDRQLGGKQGKGLVVKNALNRLRKRFDYVCLDCPPMLGVLMVNALAACNELVIPVQTEFLALKGLERMMNTLHMVQRSRPQGVPYRIVPTLFDRRTRESVQALRELRETYGDNVWEGVIPVDTRFREASRSGSPLTVMHPWSRGSQAYRLLLESLMPDGKKAPRSAPAASEEVL